MRVGFLGTGEIATAMVHGLAGEGHQIKVSERNAENAAALAAAYPDVEVLPNAELVEGSDVVFLCLMADVARNILTRLPWRADHVVISAMVGLPRAELAALCAPATDIAITIPLGPIAIGGSVLPVHPEVPVIRELFGGRNTVIPVADEDGIGAYFIASALAAPTLAQLQAGADWLAAQTGDKKGAEAYIAGMFFGFLRQISQSDASFDDLLQGLATEGGLNATLRARMEEAGTLETLNEGFEALKPRFGL